MGMPTALPRGGPAREGQPFGQPETILWRRFNTRNSSRTGWSLGGPTDGPRAQIGAAHRRDWSETVNAVVISSTIPTTLLATAYHRSTYRRAVLDVKADALLTQAADFD
ncbi:hypothetical protein D3C76_1598640 [compost metagenome]